MNRISHRELEDLRTDLALWVANKKSQSGFLRVGYGGVVKLAINYYHKTNNYQDAYKHLIKSLDNRGLNNLARRQEAENELLAYCSWQQTNSSIFIESRPRISLTLASGIILGGEISRIDMDPSVGNYRAILLGNYASNWQSELRMPLIQKAIAERIHRDASDVLIGVQHLTGNDLQLISYSEASITDALDEASILTGQAAALLA